jgi:uncharacterized protein (TIGR03000 family)
MGSSRPISAFHGGSHLGGSFGVFRPGSYALTSPRFSYPGRFGSSGYFYFPYFYGYGGGYYDYGGAYGPSPFYLDPYLGLTPPYFAPTGPQGVPPRPYVPSETPGYLKGQREEDMPAPTDNAVHLQVRVPANAEVWIGGAKTAQTGTLRQFKSPPLTPGKTYSYTIRARWVEDGRLEDQTREVLVSANAALLVDFLAPPPPEKVPVLPKEK